MGENVKNIVGFAINHRKTVHFIMYQQFDCIEQTEKKTEKQFNYFEKKNLKTNLSSGSIQTSGLAFSFSIAKSKEKNKTKIVR